MKHYSLLSIFLVVLFLTSKSATGNEITLPEYLPQDLEIELALSAGPMEIRKEASVMILTEEGYKTVKEGSNGFLCLVVRGNSRFPDILAPICYDKQGAETIGKVHIESQNLRKQGLDEAEVQQRIANGFRQGLFPTPLQSGIIYMLSPVVFVPDTEERGKMMTYIPHFMMYAPYMSPEDIGFEASVTRTKKHMFSGMPFMNGNGPHNLLVIPLGEKERMEIAKEHKELIKKMKEYLPLEIR